MSSQSSLFYCSGSLERLFHPSALLLLSAPKKGNQLMDVAIASAEDNSNGMKMSQSLGTYESVE